MARQNGIGEVIRHGVGMFIMFAGRKEDFTCIRIHGVGVVIGVILVLDGIVGTI